MSSSKTYVVEYGSRPVLRVRGGMRIQTPDELEREYLQGRQGRPRRLWVAGSSSPFRHLAEHVGARTSGRERLLLLANERVSEDRKEFLRTLFDVILSVEPGRDETFLLPRSQLEAVLGSDDRQDLIVGGVVDREDRVIVLFRGDLDRVVVPFEWFEAASVGTTPDLREVSAVDHGHALKLGDHEAATDAILYEFDADYRRRAKTRQLELDESLGGSLRRLRLQRGLTQDDFDPLSARQIRRIEKGTTAEPRSETLRIIADRLGVAADEIETY